MNIPPFRPYGGEDYRVVSDLSRFDHENNTPKLRSRNTTPTNTEITQSSKLTIDTIIPLYSSKIDQGQHPYQQIYDHTTNTERKKSIRPKHISVAIQVPQDHFKPKPKPPPKDFVRRSRSEKEFLPYPASINEPNLEIPPQPQPQPLLEQQAQLQPHQIQQYSKPQEHVKFQPQQFVNNDSASILSRQKQLEHDLVKTVMNRPLISFKADRFGEQYHGQYITITINFLLYLFEICCSIIEIVLSSVLLEHDTHIAIGIYRYFIADGIISLIISLLFILKAVNYEKRNGNFYCLVATIIKLVSFILIISYVFPTNNSGNNKIWSIRRAVGSFIIISTFLWIVNLIMFLTTLYISRLNLLEELNFDYGRKGLDDEFNKGRKSEKEPHYEEEEEPLKEFYLNENGEMYELNEHDKNLYKGKNKILVYTF
ncbi:uncharacterized protein KGF55_003536 [Candida pseudojiufengensis]|uniref:uncharacterized protein n=1 Tax=Candida pseudojiufengensis TaxID=497109 RepID=UPI002224DA54|nr:uncharacterized protein KGF55_003536 [Candida pseudojiufengensis]KAI5962460.1 hypothetical protein KGF55_003536 [Candida pseudojiufengensis]